MRFLVLLLTVNLAGAATWYVSPNGTGNGSISSPWHLQTALTNSSLSAGDTIYARGGTYTPNATNIATFNEYAWTVGRSGTAGNLITLQSYPGEWAAIDLQWRFSVNRYWRFQSLEFYDSNKGAHTNPGAPNGPFLHFDDSGLGTGNEWINLVIHDVSNCWASDTGGALIRGCILWHIGINQFDHVVYPRCDNFIGNIVGWCAGDLYNLGAASPAFTMSSNIFFNTHIGDDMRAGDKSWTYTYNYSYITTNAGSRHCLQVSGTGTHTVSNNVLVSRHPLRVLEGITNFVVRGNVIHNQEPTANYPAFTRIDGTGWDNDFNTYSAITPRTVQLEDNSIRYSLANWQSTFSTEMNSTAANSSYPADAVYVIPNQDTPRRAHIAVYNWTQADNVSVNLSAVLNSGDIYQLYSAQNYSGGPLRSGVFGGTTISIPMTNLTVAQPLYGMGGNVTNQFPTTPEFGAFVIQGINGGVNIQAAKLNGASLGL
jgi:hypothetical protein